MTAFLSRPISRSGVTSVAPSPLASSGAIEDPTAQTNVFRIARGLATALAQRGGSVTLRLTPPDLGTLRINLQINGARVSAGFQIESEAARTLLTQQIGQLRTSLENAGLSVERLSVQSMTSSSPSGLQHQGGQSATDEEVFRRQHVRPRLGVTLRSPSPSPKGL